MFYQISRLGSIARSPHEIGPRILDEFCKALGFTRAEIWLLGPERRTMRLFCTCGEDYSAVPRAVTMRDCTFTLMVMRHRQGVLHPNPCRGTADLARWAPWNVVTSVFGAPLRARGRILGVLIADRHGRRFDMTAEELELATAIAALMAEVIDSSLEREAKAKRHRQMMMLNQASRAISAEERQSALLSRLARIVLSQTGCVGVVIRLFDEISRSLRVVAAAGPGAAALRGQQCPTRGGRGTLSPGALAFLSDRPAVINRAEPLRLTETYWHDVRSALVVPIRVRERPIGVLRLEATERFTFDEGDIKIFSVLAEQIGHAVRRARVVEALRSKQAELRAVSESLEERLEEDRRRIARELHDELAQAMTAAKLNLGMLREKWTDSLPGSRRLIRDTEALLNDTIAAMRRISMDLRPAMLDELGLMPALRWYTGTFSGRSGIAVTLRGRGTERRLRRHLETLLYRFVQEALTNVARHSRARQVQIALSAVDGHLRAVVTDDGVGMAVRGSGRAGLGLLGMRERIERIGGRLRIVSRRGTGTRLEASFPLDPIVAGAEAPAPWGGRDRRRARVADRHLDRSAVGREIGGAP